MNKRDQMTSFIIKTLISNLNKINPLDSLIFLRFVVVVNEQLKNYCKHINTVAIDNIVP